ncbi:hypothetical protein RIF29_35233 [Crotalaria pallida]|uniref:DUF4283 domain-containing protein n=1 Tax=Crotalaria pallida TaxID=3830 RepID=A0AAN9EFG0_CROPI
MDGMLLGNNRVMVNIPRFNRGFRNNGKEINKTGGIVNQRGEIRNQRTYADVLKNKGVEGRLYRSSGAFGLHENKVRKEGDEEDWKGMKINIPDAELEWISKGFVGRVEDYEKAWRIQDIMQEEGITTIKAIPMGDQMVLLLPMEGENLQDLIQEVGDNLGQHFEYIKSWSEDMVAGNKLAWIRCAGIPPHAWNEMFFKAITGPFGELIKPDDDTKLRRRLDMARVLIRTSNLLPIFQFTRVMINQNLFTIRLCEEVWNEGLITHPADKEKSLHSTAVPESASEEETESQSTDEWVSESMEFQESPVLWNSKFKNLLEEEQMQRE